MMPGNKPMAGNYVCTGPNIRQLNKPHGEHLRQAGWLYFAATLYGMKYCRATSLAGASLAGYATTTPFNCRLQGSVAIRLQPTQCKVIRLGKRDALRRYRLTLA